MKTNNKKIEQLFNKFKLNNLMEKIDNQFNMIIAALILGMILAISFKSTSAFIIISLVTIIFATLSRNYQSVLYSELLKKNKRR